MKQLITSLLILLCSVIPRAYAGDYITSITLTLDDGAPITAEQSIRLSLWRDGRIRSGDISSGTINTSAPYYSNYQTVVTTTPDSEGRVRIAFGDLSNFPEAAPENQFMMIEYKDSGDPDTAYVVYTDTYINGTDLDRFALVNNGPDIFHGIYANDATTSDLFILDFDNDATDITIQFGEILAESLMWDDTNDYFFLSDALVVDGNLNLQGTALRLDSDETGNPDQDVDIIAPQGSENDGTIRYDDGENAWQLSNDGGSFFEILTRGTILPAVQARRTTTLSLGTSFADVTFDTTDLETDSTRLDHDGSTTDRILIEEDGVYLVSYAADMDITSGLLQAAASVSLQVRVNDTSVINGSTSSAAIPGGIGTFIFPIERTFMVSLSQGDFLSIQMQRAGGGSATLQTNATFRAQRISG